MVKKEKIVGVCYHSRGNQNPKDELKQIRDMGVTWLRMPAPFPWEDKIGGKLSDAFKNARDKIKFAQSCGMNIMTTSPGLGAYRFDPDKKVTYWQNSWPAFAGEKGTTEFYDNVGKTTKFLCEELGEYISGYWQIMNEINISVFTKDYMIEIPTETARVSVEGIVEADKKAQCGINLADYFFDRETSVKVADMTYRPGHKFTYVGNDQYFGSWQGGTVEDWSKCIDELWNRYKLPVLANEWGYSSGGEVTLEHPDSKKIPLGWMDVCAAHKWFNECDGGHTEEVQAEYIRRGLEIFAKHPHCIGSFVFCWKDAPICYHCGQAECPAECFWGVVRSDLTPKKAYYAIQKVIGDYY